MVQNVHSAIIRSDRRAEGEKWPLKRGSVGESVTKKKKSALLKLAVTLCFGLDENPGPLKSRQNRLNHSQNAGRNAVPE